MNEVLVYIKTILYILNGRIEIVGILLARVKIYAASEKLSGCYIYLKNHNLCIILILFFLLGINISHIYNEESNVYIKIAATRGAHRPPV